MTECDRKRNNLGKSQRRQKPFGFIVPIHLNDAKIVDVADVDVFFFGQ